jgi:hypothetical protein
MNVWINHYKATSEINLEQYFDLEEYKDFSSIDLNIIFANLISDREFYSWETILIGTPDLTLTEKLHSINEIDITSGLDTIIVNSKEAFTDFCINEYIKKYDFKYSNMSIYELPYESKIAYGLEVYKQKSTQSIFVNLDNFLSVDIPKSHLNDFKENFLYVNKNDLEKMFRELSEEFKDDFRSLIIAEFEPGISIIQIEY